MAVIDVEVNGRKYPVGCEDGQEGHLIGLARDLDEQVRAVAAEVGQVGDQRLLLMAALMIADEVADLKARAETAEAAVARGGADRQAAERRAARALDDAAARIDRIAAR